MLARSIGGPGSCLRCAMGCSSEMTGGGWVAETPRRLVAAGVIGTVADASLDHPEIAYKRVPLCNTHRHKMNAGTPNTTIQFSKRKGPIWDWSKRNADI